ncbi:class I SAM-dependent methyltransferase [Paenibacillus ginsengihumi]|uniref:class I SAM-dependent methyltransferase n=1 Tax=Paenibacillus ginsengihumi TaxID=431596 RepID=UPI000360FAB2|nr:SAM-dependent methyltransferase [Paenibacillus ginsengihumi]
MLQTIRERIARSPAGAIRFSEYMSLCLYEPEQGYYMRPRPKLGPQGDYYTSASIGTLMGETLAAYAASRIRLWPDDGQVTIAEWGGGDGKLARSLLDELQSAYPSIYERLAYVSVEASPYHRLLQADRLKPHESIVRIMDEAEWNAVPSWEKTFVLSNELLDAMPVHIVSLRQEGWRELHVAWDEQAEALAERWLPVTDRRLAAYIQGKRLPERQGQRFEVNLAAADWIGATLRRLRSGEIVTIDYGDTASELWAEHRMNGTLLCYRNHQASDTPLQAPGEQDMTAHVNFTDVLEAGEAAGACETVYMSQKQFLVENGLLHKLRQPVASDPFGPEARRNRSIRQLLLSDGMSELFKVVIQRKSGPR